jgi:hypothetical protein
MLYVLAVEILGALIPTSKQQREPFWILDTLVLIQFENVKSWCISPEVLAAAKCVVPILGCLPSSPWWLAALTIPCWTPTRFAQRGFAGCFVHRPMYLLAFSSTILVIVSACFIPTHNGRLSYNDQPAVSTCFSPSHVTSWKLCILICASRTEN